MKEINMKFLALSLMVAGGSMFMHNAFATEGLSDNIQKLGAAHIKSADIEQFSVEDRTRLLEIVQNRSKLGGLTKSDKRVMKDLRKEVLRAKRQFPELFANETATAAIGTENVSNGAINQENGNTNVAENEQNGTVATVESVSDLNEVDALAVQNNNAVAIEMAKEQAIEKVQEVEVTQEKQERPQMQAKAVQMANVSVQNTNMNLTEVPYFVKIYKNNVDNYQYFIKNNMNDKDGFSFKFSVNATTGKSIINDNTTYDSKSPEVAFGIQNKLNDNFKVSFDTMYKEQKYDLDNFKDVKDKMLFVSANAEGTTKIADLNAGYIFSNKLNSDINKSGNGLVGKLDNTNHRFFATVGKKFELYDNLYLSTNAGANFDIIGMKNFKVHDNLGNSTEIKDKNHFLTTETLDIMLNKEMLLNKMKLNLFAGVNFNHTNKTINMSDKDGDAIAKFKVKTHNYFVGGIDFRLNDTFGLKTTYKNNLSKSKDNQINLGINMNI